MKHRKQWLHAYIRCLSWKSWKWWWLALCRWSHWWLFKCMHSVRPCTQGGKIAFEMIFRLSAEDPQARRTCLSGVPLQAARLNACCREEAREKLKTLRRSSSALRFLQKTDDVLGSEKEHFTNGLKAVPSPIWSYHAGGQCPKIRDLRFCFGLPRRSEKIKTSHHDHIRAGRLNASSDFARVHRAPDGQQEKRSDLENIQLFFKKCR